MTAEIIRVPWWAAEPSRLYRDREEVTAAYSQMLFVEEGQAGWRGRLPVWPFERTKPAGLDRLTGGLGLSVVLSYGAAYPLVSPWIFPVEPEPQPLELTQTRWHVLGNGALCLFQTQADWDPASSVVDLLQKAAGWRIEYALLKAGARQDMTMAGIVRDDSLDHLVTEVAERLDDPQSWPSPPIADGGP